MQHVWQHPWQRRRLTLGSMIRPTTSDKLVFSIAEAAELLGVSDDLIYELTARGELPCLRLGRRKVIPAVAIQAVIDGCLDGIRISERRQSGHAERALEISDPPVEALLAREREEAVVLIEGERPIGDGIHDDGAGPELPRPGDRPQERVT